ncbi:MAG TPA: HupE/UreJ family protein [Acidobacteriota bacterium]|jgi:hydrogenase/urease accessory protein HupE|nr:HupE/UreJ family protein [Acidobacteriota bacterium]
MTRVNSKAPQPASRPSRLRGESFSARIFTTLIVLFVLLAGRIVQAHDPGLSSVEMRLQRDRLEACMTLARKDVEALSPLAVGNNSAPPREPTATALAQLEKIAFNAMEVYFDGQKAEPEVKTPRSDNSGAVQFTLHYPRKTGSHLAVHLPILKNLPSGHRQFFSLKDANGSVVIERMLNANANVVELDAASAFREESPAGQFLLLGIRHILTGYDHLLFLIGLLLAGGGLLQISKIVTSFTVAHSITLALATLNLAQIPPGIVEPMIAASIVYVGVENIFAPHPKRRWVLAFGFGLIHGFGFSSALRELGIGAGGVSIAVPLFSFNFGVELGQAAVVLLVLPLIWWLKRQPNFVIRYAPAFSILVALIGTFWFVQRALFG